MNENYIRPMGGSPGLVVMWGDSCSPNTGRTFSQLCGVNIVMFVWKTKINQNETWDGPLKVTFVQIRTHFLIIRLWSYAIRYSTLAMIFFFKKNGPIPASFCLFLSFSHYNFNNRKKHRWCAWDLNPGPQDGRRRRNHRAMAATPWLWFLI